MITPTLPLSRDFIQAHASKLTPILSRFEDSGSLHSTLLFTGVEGVGKKSFVLYLLQLLFCDRSIFARANEKEEETQNMFGAMDVAETNPPSATSPCGECQSCIRASQNQFLDLFWFEPETNEEGTRLGQHKIDAFRELKSKLGYGPSEEPFKVVVITDAERMTTAAANSILKMLEEPPPNWLFILTTSDASRVLPTILSRCNEVKLNPLPPEVIFSILKMSKGLDFSGARGKVAARASFGSLTRAMLFLEDDTWELRSKILGFLSQPTHEWMKLIDTLSSSQRDMHLGLDVLESVLSDLLAFKVFGNNHRFIHEDQKDFLIQLTEAKHFTVENLSRTLEKLAELRSLTNLTLNAKLLAQEALIPVLNLWLPS